MSLFDRAIVAVMPLIPKAIVGRVARPYIAGATLDDGVLVVRGLMDEGCMATMDVLGEEVTSASQAESFTRQYLQVLDRIQSDSLDANISVKLSALGQAIDVDLCRRNIRSLMDRALQHDNFVRLDMEDSSTTDSTLGLYRELRAEYQDVGVVLQSMLRRSIEDVRALIPLHVNVRVCKGIYVEPAEVAYKERQEVRDSFMDMVETLLGAGCYVGIATHDRQLVERSQDLVARMGLDRGRYEFQMLLGVEAALRRQIVEAGHRMRVYVPFGEAWYAYSTRRLKENPAVAGHILRAIFTGRR